MFHYVNSILLENWRHPMVSWVFLQCEGCIKSIDPLCWMLPGFFKSVGGICVVCWCWDTLPAVDRCWLTVTFLIPSLGRFNQTSGVRVMLGQFNQLGQCILTGGSTTSQGTFPLDKVSHPIGALFGSPPSTWFTLSNATPQPLRPIR